MTLRTIQQISFFILLLGTTSVFVWMLGKYVLPVFWATVIAIIFYPLYLRIYKQIGKRKNTASFLTLFLVAIALIVPLSIIGTLVAQESLVLYQNLSNNQAEQGISFFAEIETLTQYLAPLGIDVSAEAVAERFKSELASLAENIAASTIAIGQGTFSFLLQIAITIYLLFFFFRDGNKLAKRLASIVPIARLQEERLFARFSDTIRGIVQGTLTVAIIQGIIGGAAFWIVGISAPILWGVVMTLMAIIPMAGPALVWFPVAFFLLLSGLFWEGIFILSVGVILVSVLDEFVRPILVGRKTKLPDAVVLLATVGGIATFGISGFVIGPVIAAFFITLWLMFEEQYKKELADK